MTLANYINDLLYRYDCVIIPNFGGFITNKTGARINNSNHKMYPPKKEVTFNAYLKHNDGLLANYIALNEKISFEQALIKIEEVVTEWKFQLAKKTIEITEVGSLSLNEENRITFEPNLENNFLQESFGLVSVASEVIKRVFKDTLTISTKKERTIVIPVFVKRTVAAAVVLGTGYLSWDTAIQNRNKQEFISQEKISEKKIQSANFIIDNPLPIINLEDSKDPEPTNKKKKFHIIAGAFQLEKNAKNKVLRLKKQGYDAEILGENSWGLTQVTFKSYETREEAIAALIEIKETISKEAWLLEK